MATYTGSGFPPWATVSSSGLVSISSTAPVSSATVSVSMTQNGQTYTRDIVLNVLEATEVVKYFTLSNTLLMLSSIKLSLDVVMSVSRALDLQSPNGRLSIALSVTQEFVQAPPQAILLSKLAVELSLTQTFVPHGYGYYG